MGIYLSKDGISYLWAKIKNKFYSKPSGGIPKSDLVSSVQASLGKADSALQSHQDISGKQDKLTAGANITISGNTISAKDTTYSSKSAVSGGTDVSLVTTGEKAVWNAKTSNTGTITGIKMNGVSKGTSGVVDLGTVITAHQDISGKQDKTTAVTHTANTAVGSATKPVYVAANGAATAITHSINADVPANAKFTDTTYSDATQTSHGLMTAADKKKLDGMDLSKYLPLAGGTMSGNIDMMTNAVEVRVSDGPPKTTPDRTLPMSGVINGTSGGTQSDLKNKRSFIGSYSEFNGKWNNLISVRHRNGYNDGTSFGMYLRSVLTEGGSIIWNKQTAANTWQGERVLLDTTNYRTYAATSDHTHKIIDRIGNVGYYGSDAANTAGWYKFYSGTLTGYNDVVVRLSIMSTYAPYHHGILDFNIRCENSNWLSVHMLHWEVRYGFHADDVIVVLNGNNYFLYVNRRNPQYGRIKIRVLESAGTSTAWDMTLASNFAKELTAPTPTVVASDGCTVANATTWNGLVNDVDTYNGTDTWILVKKDNKIQHRYAGELDVNSAKTLVDSGWKIPTFPSDIKSSTIRYRKQGKIVCVSGNITVSASTASITPFTLPEGYRPSQDIEIAQAVNNSSQDTYIVKIYANGKVLYTGKKQGFFTTSNTYYMHVTYFVD